MEDTAHVSAAAQARIDASSVVSHMPRPRTEQGQDAGTSTATAQPLAPATDPMSGDPGLRHRMVNATVEAGPVAILAVSAGLESSEGRAAAIALTSLSGLHGLAGEALRYQGVRAHADREQPAPSPGKAVGSLLATAGSIAWAAGLFSSIPPLSGVGAGGVAIGTFMRLISADRVHKAPLLPLHDLTPYSAALRSTGTTGVPGSPSSAVAAPAVRAPHTSAGPPPRRYSM
jgi:hypothetical protein